MAKLRNQEEQNSMNEDPTFPNVVSHSLHTFHHLKLIPGFPLPLPNFGYSYLWPLPRFCKKHCIKRFCQKKKVDLAVYLMNERPTTLSNAILSFFKANYQNLEKDNSSKTKINFLKVYEVCHKNKFTVKVIHNSTMTFLFSLIQAQWHLENNNSTLVVLVQTSYLAASEKCNGKSASSSPRASARLRRVHPFASDELISPVILTPELFLPSFLNWDSSFSMESQVR